MKRWIPFLVIALASLTPFRVAKAGQAETESRLQKPVAITGLERKLETLILPKVDFKEASVGAVLEFLRQKAASVSGKRLDPSFVVTPGVDTSVPVTLHLANIPFMEALRYLSDLASVEFVVDQYAISVKSKAAGSPRMTTKAQPSLIQMNALKSLVIPKVNFKDASLESALEGLRQQALTISKGQTQPNFVIEPGLDASKSVTLNLVNIPFTEVLLYLGDVASAEFVVDRYAISVTPRAESSTRMTAKTPPDSNQLQTLQSLIIPKIEFKETSLESVLEILQQKAAAASNGRVHLCFVLEPKLNVLAPVSLNLQNIPLTEFLKYLGQVANVEFVVERYAISVKRKVVPVNPTAAPTPFGLVK